MGTLPLTLIRPGLTSALGAPAQGSGLHTQGQRFSAAPLWKIIHRFSTRTSSIYFTLSEDIPIDKLTDQNEREMPDLKSRAKSIKF